MSLQTGENQHSPTIFLPTITGNKSSQKDPNTENNSQKIIEKVDTADGGCKKRNAENQRIADNNENKRVIILGVTMTKNEKRWEMSKKMFVRIFLVAKVVVIFRPF